MLTYFSSFADTFSHGTHVTRKEAKIRARDEQQMVATGGGEATQERGADKPSFATYVDAIPGSKSSEKEMESGPRTKDSGIFAANSSLSSGTAGRFDSTVLEGTTPETPKPDFYAGASSKPNAPVVRQLGSPSTHHIHAAISISCSV